MDMRPENAHSAWWLEERRVQAARAPTSDPITDDAHHRGCDAQDEGEDELDDS